MFPRAHRLSLAIVMLAVVSCAGGTRSAATTQPSARIIPPRLMSRVDIQFSRMEPGRASFEVLIKPDGTPELGTLKLVGALALSNQMAITDWLRRVTFRPATQNGTPVAAVYRQTFELRRGFTIRQ